MEVFGWLYTISFAICYIPQIVKTLQTKKVEDISISLFGLSLIGYISAIIYTINEIGYNYILLLNYSFGGLCSLIMIIAYLQYREKINIDMCDEFYNSNYYKFLKQEMQEINKLKWIESEKEGRDIGKDKAVFLWIKYYRQDWIKSQIDVD